MCVQTTVKLTAAAARSYKQWTRFRTTLDFMENISGTDQVIDKQKTALSTTIFPRSMQTIRFTKEKKWPWPLTQEDLKFNRVRAVVKVRVCAKYHQAECSGSSVIVYTNVFAISRKIIRKSGSVILTFDLEILWVLSGCQDTRCCKISSSYVQRFTSYRGHRGKKSQTKTIQSVATARTV